MTLLSYEIFHTVMEQGSFARAAALLHLTPSAISHAVSSMEEEIGFPLFIRSRQGVRLTPSGSRIYPYIHRIIAENKKLHQAVAQMQGLEMGSVKIGCTNTVCLRWIPGILQRFQTVYPQIDVEIYQGSYADVIQWIKSGTTDLGIVSEAVRENLPFSPLCQDDLVCVAPRHYMSGDTLYITPEDLKNQPFVIQQEGCDTDITNFLNNYRLTVRANCHVLDDQSTLAMVECGVGISIMPKLFMETVSCNVDVFPIRPAQYRTLGVCSLDMESLSPSAQEMVTCIRQFVEGEDT